MRLEYLSIIDNVIRKLSFKEESPGRKKDKKYVCMKNKLRIPHSFFVNPNINVPRVSNFPNLKVFVSLYQIGIETS